MLCKFDDSFQARPGWICLKAVIKLAWHIPVPNVQWKTPNDRQRNCPKHVEILDKNKFGKISASLGFIKKNLQGSSFIHLSVRPSPGLRNFNILMVCVRRSTAKTVPYT
jgi:hypothetical protein